MLCVHGDRAEFRAEYGKHCQHPDQFRGERRFEYKAGQPDDAADLMGRDAFLPERVAIKAVAEMMPSPPI